MALDVYAELEVVLKERFKPYGYNGHLLSLLEPKKKPLEEIIKRTALMGESNSMLVMGPPGSGKSALLECVIDEVFQNHLVKENMFHVALNGVVHTNDNLALEDITRQLKLKEDEDKSLGNFSEKLRLLLSTLKSGTKESQSVLFVLDKFELFCSHKNQNLLYNLFDIAQSQQTPICVIGVSSHPGLLQQLENRVNSRFSHQKTMLFDEITVEEYFATAKELLLLKNFKDSLFQKRWNASIEILVKNAIYRRTLQYRYNCTRSLRDLKELLLLSVIRVDKNHPYLIGQDLEDTYYEFNYADSRAALLLGLSVLQMALVIAMMHITEIYDNEPFNFEIAFNELSRFLNSKMRWNIDKPVVMKAFEHLLELNLVRSTGGPNLMKRYMPVRLLVTPKEVREAVDTYMNLPAPLKHWTESSVNW